MARSPASSKLKMVCLVTRVAGLTNTLKSPLNVNQVRSFSSILYRIWNSKRHVLKGDQLLSDIGDAI